MECVIKSFIDKLGNGADVRVARALLLLMTDSKTYNDFECELMPLDYGVALPVLRDSVERLMKQLVLDDFASVTVNHGKVAVVVPAGALAAAPVQAKIAAELTKIQQQVAQLGP